MFAETPRSRPPIWLLACGWFGLAIVGYALTGRPHDQLLMRGIGPVTLAVTAVGALLFGGAVIGGTVGSRSMAVRGAAGLALALAAVGSAVLLRHPALGHPEFPHRDGELAATRWFLLFAALSLTALWRLGAVVDLRAAYRAASRSAGDLVYALAGAGLGRLRRALPNGVLVVTSMSLAVLAAEATVRMMRGVPLLETTNLVTARTDLIGVQRLTRYDPTLGWVLADNQTPSPDFSTGQYGVRMNRDGIHPVPRHAVLAVGDSFTAGSEVANEETWPALLERLLDRPIVNAATGGWGADQIVLRAELLLPELAPRVVVVSFLAHDIIRASFSTFGGGNKAWFTVHDGQLVAHDIPVPRFSGSAAEIGLVRRLLGSSQLIDFVAQRLGLRERWIGTAIVQQPTDFVTVSCLLLQRLHRKTAAERIPLHFLLQYQAESLLHETVPPSYAAAVVACARDDGIATLDSWDALHALAVRDPVALEALFHSEPDGTFGHMTEAGNRFVARLLAAQLGAD